MYSLVLWDAPAPFARRIWWIFSVSCSARGPGIFEPNFGFFRKLNASIQIANIISKVMKTIAGEWREERERAILVTEKNEVFKDFSIKF